MIAKTWRPQHDPNPSEILHSAVDDTREGSHEQALAKLLWFHENALEIEPGLTGVRLSFAFGYWLDLASVYPPARDAFIRIRDETEAAFREEPSNFNLFQDLASMNDRLGDGIRTAGLFANVAERDRATATRLYHVAEPHLIAAGQYHACGPFLDPNPRLERAHNGYRTMKQHEEEAKTQYDIPIPQVARPLYVQNVATFVALLVINDRAEDARNAYDVTLQVFNDDEFRMIMDTAMTGHLPAKP